MLTFTLSYLLSLDLPLLLPLCPVLYFCRVRVFNPFISADDFIAASLLDEGLDGEGDDIADGAGENSGRREIERMERLEKLLYLQKNWGYKKNSATKGRHGNMTLLHEIETSEALYVSSAQVCAFPSTRPFLYLICIFYSPICCLSFSGSR